MKLFNFNRAGDVAMVSEQQPVVLRDPMTKGDLSKCVAKLTGTSRIDVDKIIDCYLAEIASTLKDGCPVVITGFGKFKPRKPRTGKYHNPVTGERGPSPERKSVCFQPSQILKKTLNN